MLSRRRTLLLSALVGTALAVPMTTGAANPITVEVIVGQWCISGTGPSRAEVIATLRTPGGHQRDQFRSRSDRFGSWSGCFRIFEPSTFINGDDRLHIRVGAKSRNVHVPRLEPMIDRVADTIEGWAPPLTQVDIAVTHQKTFRRSSERFFTAMSDANGRWRVDTTASLNLIGGDEVTVLVQRGNDTFGSLALVPGMQIANANNVVVGSVNNGTRLELTINDRNGQQKANSTAGPVLFGLFEVAMFEENGKAAYPVPRDHVIGSFASDADLRVPVSQLVGSASDDMVMGRCMASAPYALLAGSRAFFGTTNTDGRFTRDVGTRMNLRRGDDLTLYCMYPTGDTWQRTAIAL